MLRAHVALLTTSRRADAGYATSERDAKRAQRAGANQKKCFNPVLLAAAFLLLKASTSLLKFGSGENN
jgi:hypothetical protein